jgi:putative salt-induced outer membrane protein YdiY
LLGLAVGAGTLRGQDAPPAEEAPKPKWQTTARAGVTVTRGNSDTVLFTSSVQSQRLWEKNELRLGADGAYGKNEDVKNTETLHGFAQYNRLLSERMFGYARLDALHDAIADVEYRLTFSPGGGYYFVKNTTTSLSAEVGPGIVHEKLGQGSNTYMTLRVGERFEHKLNERARVWQSLEWLPQVDDFNNYILNAQVGVETALTKRTTLALIAQDTYDNVPAPGRQKNDLKIVAQIGYKF